MDGRGRTRPLPLGEAMKIAALVHFYPPFRNAGSETMLHRMLQRLQKAGHQVKVFTTHLPDAPDRYVYDGIPVASTNIVVAQQLLKEFNPEVIITHHDNSVRALKVARQICAKSVFLMHNDFDISKAILYRSPDLVVFNTRWMQEKFRWYRGQSLVVHPPIWAEDHRTTPGDCVTLVNLNEHKGSLIFYELAQRMPHVRFLGVVGGHGQQIIRRDLPNVTIQDHTDDMPGDVWSRTRILLMPSLYESYGMAGVEALASGIPVIANPTNGLTESLGHAGIFVHRDDIDGWQREIERLLDHKQWEAASKRAEQRSAELDPSAELDAWVDAIEELCVGTVRLMSPTGTIVRVAEDKAERLLPMGYRPLDGSSETPKRRGRPRKRTGDHSDPQD